MKDNGVLVYILLYNNDPASGRLNAVDAATTTRSPNLPLIFVRHQFSFR